MLADGEPGIGLTRVSASRATTFLSFVRLAIPPRKRAAMRKLVSRRSSLKQWRNGMHKS